MAAADTLPGSLLLLGGARSGKSTLALELASDAGRPVLFLATAVAGDEDMHARIARHRLERPAGWRTVEEPLAIAEAIRRETQPGDLVLVDCITFWVANLLLREPLAGDSVDLAAYGRAAAEVVAAIRDTGVATILVSNEVGLGVVPPSELGRAYRDALGHVNQVLGRAAERVLLLVAGLPIDLTAVAGSSLDGARRVLRPTQDE